MRFRDSLWGTNGQDFVFEHLNAERFMPRAGCASNPRGRPRAGASRPGAGYARGRSGRRLLDQDADKEKRPMVSLLVTQSLRNAAVMAGEVAWDLRRVRRGATAQWE